MFCMWEQALLLALRLWPAMPKELQSSCPLLPAARIPSSSWAAGRTTAYAASAEAASGFFQPSHLAKLLPVLRGTTAAHPRLHLLWPTLLALLLPGFAPKRVSEAAIYGAAEGGCAMQARACHSALAAMPI